MKDVLRIYEGLKALKRRNDYSGLTIYKYKHNI
jgi:hypothetical protein